MDIIFDQVGRFPASESEAKYLSELSAAHPAMSKKELLSWMYISRCLQLARESESRISSGGHHVLATDLLGVARLASLQIFGEHAPAWLSAIGIHGSRDFGKIVYRFIELGALASVPEDKPEDFYVWSDLDAFLKQSNKTSIANDLHSD